MVRFKFSVLDWKSFLVIPLVTTSLLRLLKDYIGFALAAGFAGLAGLACFFLANRIFSFTASFYDSHLSVKNGPYGETKLFYPDIKGLNFTNDRYKTLNLSTASGNIKLPPAQLHKVEELSAWLKTQNQAIQTNIIKNHK